MKKQLSKFCSVLLSATLLISTSFIATSAKTIRADGDWTYKVLNADVMVITENSLKAIDGVLG